MADETLQLFEEAQRALDEGRLDQAQEGFERFLKAVPDHAAAWYNLALIHKRRRDWRPAVECGVRAVTGGAEKGDPALWNLGIAATALREWKTARFAWTSYGIELPPGTGEIRAAFGWAPIRIDAETDGEVVWGERIDPARVRVLSVPISENYGWGDVVLHDGEPRGQREVEGRTYSVFDAIELWQRCEFPTEAMVVRCPGLEDSTALQALFESAGYGAEDWAGSIEMICKACSEGTVHKEHVRVPAPWKETRRWGVAAPAEVKERLLAEWLAGAQGREIVERATGR